MTLPVCLIVILLLVAGSVGGATAADAPHTRQSVHGYSGYSLGGALYVNAFPSFADGRGFSLARHLRGRGYAGRLRATGPVISDQYTMARRSGFDEVEIPDDLAARQPAGEWKFRADWRDHDYRSRLKA